MTAPTVWAASADPPTRCSTLPAATAVSLLPLMPCGSVYGVVMVTVVSRPPRWPSTTLTPLFRVMMPARLVCAPTNRET